MPADFRQWCRGGQPEACQGTIPLVTTVGAGHLKFFAVASEVGKCDRA